MVEKPNPAAQGGRLASRHSPPPRQCRRALPRPPAAADCFPAVAGKQCQRKGWKDIFGVGLCGYGLLFMEKNAFFTPLLRMRGGIRVLFCLRLARKAFFSAPLRLCLRKAPFFHGREAVSAGRPARCFGRQSAAAPACGGEGERFIPPLFARPGPFSTPWVLPPAFRRPGRVFS